MSAVDTIDPAQPLGAAVFRHMSWLGPEALSSLVDTLVAHGDTDSLRVGLVDGALKELPVEDAVVHCVNLLLRYARKTTSPGFDDKGQPEFQLAQEWVQQRAQSDGPGFVQLVALKLKSKTDRANYTAALEVLVRPEFGLDIKQDLQIGPDEIGQSTDPKQCYSLLGHIADSYTETALDLTGPTVERFLTTTALPPEKAGGDWLLLNLAEQIAYFNNTNERLLERIVGMVKPGTAAQDQLAELTLTLLANQDDDFLRQEFAGRADLIDQIERICKKSARLPDERAESVRAAMMMIGSGVELSNSAFAWDYIKKAQSYISANFGYVRTDTLGVIPLAHAALYLSPDVCSRARGARAISRMIEEGGVPINLTDGKGRTFLQAAAYLGHAEAVEQLLGLGADPKLTGKGAGRKKAAAIADHHGHSVVAQMIRAHEAQGAIAAVISKQKPATSAL